MPPVEAPFDTFDRKRIRWIEALEGNDPNSICRQIYDMVWDAAAFRVIVHGRELSPRETDGEPRISGLLHALLDRSFFGNQAIAVRRLIDTSSSLENLKRGVFSLGALIADCLDHAPLFTRENMLAAEGLPYDFSRRDTGTASHLDCMKSEVRHVQIDRLAGVDPSARGPGDQVRVAIHESLARRLDAAGRDVKTFVDKFLAHAATPENRAANNADEISVTFKHLWHGQQAICGIANFISIQFLGRSTHAFLAHPIFDHLEHLDQPLVAKTEIQTLDEVWMKLEREVEQWSRFGIAELEGN